MITDYKTPTNKVFQNIDDSKQKADDLNKFYCRFDNIDMSTTLDLISDDFDRRGGCLQTFQIN